jgi:hypothetical protein
MKITYYLEVLSSWCHWVEPVWAGLKARYSGRAEFEWRIALMRQGGLPVSRSPVRLVLPPKRRHRHALPLDAQLRVVRAEPQGRL